MQLCYDLFVCVCACVREREREFVVTELVKGVAVDILIASPILVYNLFSLWICIG